MRRPLLLLLPCFTLATTAFAQIARPGAFDTFQRCKGFTCVWTADSKVHQQAGAYAAYLDQANPQRSTSPDEEADELVITRAKSRVAAVPLKDLSASVTLTWAPSYSAFAVSWSDGGSIGAFHTKVYVRSGEVFSEVPAANRAFHHFQTRHNCTARGDNVQSYRFERRGRELMLILGVYDTADCGLEMGHTEGYLVRVSDGAILQCLSPHALTAYLKNHPEGS